MLLASYYSLPTTTWHVAAIQAIPYLPIIGK